jgi:hypothetical protein
LGTLMIKKSPAGHTGPRKKRRCKIDKSAISNPKNFEVSTLTTYILC